MELGPKAKAPLPLVKHLSRMAYGEALSHTQRLRSVSKEGQQVVWKDSFPPIPLRCPFQHRIGSQSPQQGGEGQVGDKGIYTVQNFQRGEKEVKKCPTRVLKSNDISNVLVWKKEKQVFMKNPNKLSFVLFFYKK